LEACALAGGEYDCLHRFSVSAWWQIVCEMSSPNQKSIQGYAGVELSVVWATIYEEIPILKT